MRNYNFFSFRYQVNLAIIRLQRNDPLQGSGREAHFGRVLIGLARNMVNAQGEDLQRKVDQFFVSKPELAGYIQEYVRRTKAARELRPEGSLREYRLIAPVEAQA